MKRLFVLAAAALTLSAADMSGIWTGQMIGRDGDPQDLSFRFVQAGDKLTGKMYGDNESMPLGEGRITGNEITFSVTNELNGQITKFVYTGTIQGQEIEMKRERTGVKPDPANADKTKNQKQTFVLKRLV
ncbi:MAG TPA: hypothetical protein VHB50_19275 [Bryobacteraceae bacterium]|nr:hypothetical protein [Bryobacteraceae bacterium]